MYAVKGILLEQLSRISDLILSPHAQQHLLNQNPEEGHSDTRFYHCVYCICSVRYDLDLCMQPSYGYNVWNTKTQSMLKLTRRYYRTIEP